MTFSVFNWVSCPVLFAVLSGDVDCVWRQLNEEDAVSSELEKVSNMASSVSLLYISGLGNNLYDLEFLTGHDSVLFISP